MPSKPLRPTLAKSFPNHVAGYRDSQKVHDGRFDFRYSSEANAASTILLSTTEFTSTGVFR